VSVPVYGKHYERVSGWQMTFGFDAEDIEIVEVIGKALDINASNYNLSGQSEGWMTMSYDSRQTQDISSKEVLFEIVVRAAEDLRSTEIFEISSGVTTAEAYRGYEEVVNVRLSDRTNREVSIKSIDPNPWVTSTRVTFEMPVSGEGRWDLYDVNGRRLYSYTGVYDQGSNSMVLERDKIGTSGIIYIKLTTDQGVAEYKMIVVQ